MYLSGTHMCTHTIATTTQCKSLCMSIVVCVTSVNALVSTEKLHHQSKGSICAIVDGRKTCHQSAHAAVGQTMWAHAGIGTRCSNRCRQSLIVPWCVSCICLLHPAPILLPEGVTVWLSTRKSASNIWKEDSLRNSLAPRACVTCLYTTCTYTVDILDTLPKSYYSCLFHSFSMAWFP